MHLRNESVTEGVTLHWHGVDVPNAMDGVAGVTQDAVPVGGEFTYRFVAERAGSFWYHSHQVADPQVRGGLFGGLVVLPGSKASGPHDVLAMAHTYGAVRTVNGRVGDLDVPAEAGDTVRVRVVNTDNAPMPLWSDAAYRVVAVDGTEVHRPQEVADQGLLLTAGGRLDVQITVPADGSARLQLSRGTAVAIGSKDRARWSRSRRGPSTCSATGSRRRSVSIPRRRPGTSTTGSVGDPASSGPPGMFWSVNGHLYPNVPMYVVREGEVVTMQIENASGQVHPMHLHGHRAVVLSHNGVAATGSPWWVDSLNVEDGDAYVVAFRGRQPGAVDGPLPQSRSRGGRHGRAPDVRGLGHTVPHRRIERQSARVVSIRGRTVRLCARSVGLRHAVSDNEKSRLFLNLSNN